MTPTGPDASVVARAQLDELWAAIAHRGYRLVGPRVREGAIVLDDVASTDDLPIGVRDVQAPGAYRLEPRQDEAVFGHVVGPHNLRRFLQLPEERLVRLRRKDTGFQVLSDDVASPPKLAFIGARACEIVAMAVQDRVLMLGEHPDERYAARRADVLVVAVSCNEPGGTCFCASMGTGPVPRSGFDLKLTELLEDGAGGHRFLVEIGSETGASIMADVARRPATDADRRRADDLADRATETMGRSLDTAGIKELLYGAVESRRWDEIAKRCLACTNCTLVCPTCFCSRIDDTTSLDGQQTDRTRRWDSCFSLNYSYIHGGPIRTSVSSRYRQWLTHKLASWFDQFGSSGCVGCGRCITWCPAGIDITEEIAAFRADREPAASPEEAP